MLYAEVLDPILARVEGCPRALALDELRNACIEFCVRTRILTTGSQVTTDGTEAPTFGLNEQVVDIFEARDKDNEQILVTFLNDPDLDDLEDDEQAITFTDPNNIELRIPGTVAAPVTISFLLCIAPGPDSTEIHEDLWRRWHEALRSGALYRLYAEPGKPWSNDKSAAYHAGRFEAAITVASAEAGRNRISPARRLRVRPA